MHWLDQLRDELNHRQQQTLRRSLRPLDRCARIVRHGGSVLLNLAGNDYLALASHPHLRDAVIEAAQRYGVGSGASRLVTGHLDIHAALEQRFAAFKHAGAALLTPTGYMANLAVLTALAAPGDLICLDKLNHASLIDAARAAGADVRVYPHGNLDKLVRLLERHGRAARRRFIVTDAVFSMDGDLADLPALCELRDDFDAVLVVDEAHATGVLGDSGAGLAEHQGVAGRVDVTVSTASKALGSLGGVVTADPVVIDTLVNHARSFIYTTAVPPTQVAALDAALDIVRDEPHRRVRLAALTRRLRVGLQQRGWPVPDDPTPIVPLVVGDAAATVQLSERLQASGYLVPAIRPPTVAPGASRLRITLRCDLTDEDVDRLVDAIGAPAKPK
ncbi:MAG: 8-amino-7-oxononanoate synthase [Phycisphaera sp.]|nr:8-amino-7-oxononanoate synthase [Phycisphaera sp.]